MATKEHNDSIILIKELNSKLRYIFSIYSISKNGLIYGVNKGEEEVNDPTHCDKFGVIYNNDILSMGELAISSINLFDTLKSFKKTKSSISISEENIKIYDNNDSLVGKIKYSNDRFIDNIMNKYHIINKDNSKKFISINSDDFYKLNELEMHAIANNQQVVINLDKYTNVYLDKDMCTDTIKETANIYISSVSKLLSYNNPDKELICLIEDIEIKKKKENILLGSIFSIFAVQKNV